MRPIIILNYSRSGGTLLNKFFGVYPNTLVLSEVNEKGCAYDEKVQVPTPTVKSQIKLFYDIDIKSDDFREGVCETYNWTEKNGKQLIIRDWSYVDFNNMKMFEKGPSYRFETLENLMFLNPIPIAIVRDSIDVWISSKMPDIHSFYKGYMKYLHELNKNNIKIFKYEDLTSKPKETFRSICDHLSIPFYDVTKSFFEFKKVNGDINPDQHSRGFESHKVLTLPRKPIPLQKITEINKSSEMKEANKLMGYPPRYHKNMIKHLKFSLLFS